MSSIQPEAEILPRKQKNVGTDEIESDASCWRDFIKTRDTRKMGRTARCLTLFHNLTIMIALLLTVNQHYEAASISLVVSMVALFRVQQEEDEKFDHEELCVAEVQQTSRSSSPRRKRRKKRKSQNKPASTVNRHETALESGRESFPKPISVVSKPPAKIKEVVSPNAIVPPQPPPRKAPPTESVAKIDESVSPASNQPEEPIAIVLSQPSPREAPVTKSTAKSNESVPRQSNKPEEPPTKLDTVGTADNFLSDEDGMAEAFDDEVAKFRARLETVQSSTDRPKIKICAGVFAKQLAAKKTAARRARVANDRTFSI